MRRLLNRLLEETSGQDLAEYALLMALLVLSAAAVLPDFAVALESAYNQMAQAFSPTKKPVATELFDSLVVLAFKTGAT